MRQRFAALAASALVALALTACSPTELDPVAATPTATPTSFAPSASAGPERSDTDGDGLIDMGNGTKFSAEGPGDCESNAAIHPYGPHDPAAQLGGELVDMGTSAWASGEVGYNAEGLIETYTVAAGDSMIGIGERFCIDYVTVSGYNDRFGTNEIQPGDVLALRP
jgi:hypothetical protein